MRRAESVLPSPVRVLVTGGSGFVGKAIVRQLRSSGFEVRVLSRSRDVGQSGVVSLRASLFDSEALVRAMAGCDAVIHLVGIISEVGSQTFERVHVEGTRCVLAAARVAGVRRYVHMSAMGARIGAPSRYHQTKVSAEELVRNSGLDWTILRPSLIYGPGDGVVSLFDRMSRWSPIVPVIGSGEGLLQPVDVADVARVFVSALSKTGTRGRTFEVGGPSTVAFSLLLRGILSRLHRRRWIVHLPLPLARLQAAVFEFVFPRVLGLASPLNRDQIAMLQEDNVADCDETWREFGLQPIAWQAGLDRMLGPAV